MPKTDVPYAVIRLGPVPPGAEVRLTDDADRLVAADVSDRRHRDFLLPWTDGDGFTGNPCIARFDTLSRVELGAVRIGLSGQVLHRVASFPCPVKAFAAGPDLVAVLDVRGVTFLDWRDPDRPHRVGAIELTDPVGVAAAGTNVIIVAASEAAMIDTDASTKPTITARVEIDGRDLFACSHSALAIVRADTVLLHTVDDGRIRPTRELQLPVAAEHLAFSDRRAERGSGEPLPVVHRIFHGCDGACCRPVACLRTGG